MANTDLVYDSIASSNMPYREKSIVRRMFDKMSEVGGGYGAHPRDMMDHSINAVRQSGEAVITGAALAAIHIERDGGLEFRKVPLDLAIAVTAIAASVVMPRETTRDAANIGGTALGIYTFRKTADMLAAKKLARGGTPGGSKPGSKVHGDYEDADCDDSDSDVGEDPIDVAARNL